NALNMMLSPSGNVLYVTVGGTLGAVEVFGNPSSGSPTPLGSAQAGTTPIGLAIDPTGTYLYAANFGDNSISAYTIGGDGLALIQGFPLGETYSAPRALFIDKSGKYLYVANLGSANLSAYGIGTDGGLALLANSPFVTGQQPSFITSDSTGKYLF